MDGRARSARAGVDIVLGDSEGGARLDGVSSDARPEIPAIPQHDVSALKSIRNSSMHNIPSNNFRPNKFRYRAVHRLGEPSDA